MRIIIQYNKYMNIFIRISKCLSAVAQRSLLVLIAVQAGYALANFLHFLIFSCQCMSPKLLKTSSVALLVLKFKMF